MHKLEGSKMQNKHEINVTFIFISRRTHLPHAVTVAIKARAANDPSVLTITEKVLTIGPSPD